VACSFIFFLRLPEMDLRLILNSSVRSVVGSSWLREVRAAG
jgi:hypothetical protein